MPTPDQLRKISEQILVGQAALKTVESIKVKEEKVKLEAEKLAMAQCKADQAISWAEKNMESVAKQGLSAALVFRIEDDQIHEGTLRSLGTGAIVDSPDSDRFFYAGAAKIVYNYFVSKGYSVMIHVESCLPQVTDGSDKKYYIKVGW